MNARSSENPRGSIVTTRMAGNLPGASRFFSHLRSRPLHWVRVWSEELDRALAATQCYDELTIGRKTDLSPRDRASKARQVFDQIYASK